VLGEILNEVTVINDIQYCTMISIQNTSVSSDPCLNFLPVFRKRMWSKKCLLWGRMRPYIASGVYYHISTYTVLDM